MSRTPSDPSAGVQVTKSANNVYTVLLVIALLALGVTAVYMSLVNNSRFGCSMPFGSQYDKAKQATADFASRLEGHKADVKKSVEFNLDSRLTTTDTGEAE